MTRITPLSLVIRASPHGISKSLESNLTCVFCQLRAWSCMYLQVRERDLKIYLYFQLTRPWIRCTEVSNSKAIGCMVLSPKKWGSWSNLTPRRHLPDPVFFQWFLFIAASISTDIANPIASLLVAFDGFFLRMPITLWKAKFTFLWTLGVSWYTKSFVPLKKRQTCLIFGLGGQYFNGSLEQEVRMGKNTDIILFFAFKDCWDRKSVV